MNTFGRRFRLTTFGESHGEAIGGVVDGCPSGIAIDLAAVDSDLQRRRQEAPRQEGDKVEWLSGLMDGVTTGTPLAFIIRNHDARSEDYEPLRHAFRPGHADYTYHCRYGLRDHRGGGRASARETAVRVVAGSIAKQIIAPVAVRAEVAQIGAAAADDTYGGVVQCTIDGLRAGVGDPIFGKLNATLAYAMMSIPSAIGFEMGDGFAAAMMAGSQFVDQWSTAGNRTTSNHCGGIQGGISNGMPIRFRVAFHPVVTLPRPTTLLNEDGTLTDTTLAGRHDRCQVVRAAVIVEAMAAICLADYMV